MKIEDKIKEYIKSIEDMGFEYGAHLLTEDINARIIKINLPESEENYKSGNGEGCFAHVINKEDMEKYDKGIGKFKVVLLNDSLYYYDILKYGTILQVEGRGNNRPVLDISWLNSILKRSQS